LLMVGTVTKVFAGTCQCERIGLSS
jgi:hypothetical protein